MIPAAWFVWSWAFFRAHPDYDLHGALSLRPSWDLLSHNVTHLGSFFDLFTPELAPSWLVPAGVFLALIAVLVSRRVAMYVVPAISAFALLLWGMTTPKADPFASLGKFLPQGRLLLMLPYLLWFLALLVAESRALRRIRVPTRAALAVLTAVTLVSLGARFVSGSVADVRDESVAYGRRGLYSFGPVENIRATCAEVRRSARQTGASIAVFVKNPAQPNEDRALAYGCGALAYGRMDTLEPDYERRTWRLYDELHRTRTAAVLWGVKRDYCGYARWRVEQCKELQPGVVAVTFKRQSLLVLLSSLEIPVRPFGPDCRPKIDLAAIGCDDPLKLSPHELVTGPPPADPNMAKALVDAAFAARVRHRIERPPRERRGRAATLPTAPGRSRGHERARGPRAGRAVPRPPPGARHVRRCFGRRAIRRVNVDRARRPRGGLLGRHPGHVLPRHVRLRPRPVLTATPDRAGLDNGQTGQIG